MWRIHPKSLFPGPPSPSVVVLVWVQSVGQIDLFKNYSYSIGPRSKNIQNRKYEHTMNVTP